MPRQESKKSKREGFTIIEVVLVLAIAGLIFLMVFIALPALQRSQRDTQRRDDMSRVDTSLVQYQTNNMSAGDNLTALPKGPSYWSACQGGNFDDADSDSDTCKHNENAGSSSSETVAKEFIQRYMNSGSDPNKNSFQDPSGVFYSMYITENLAEKAISTSAGGAKLTGDMKNGYKIGTEFNAHIIYVIPGGKCSGEAVVKDTSRHFAIMYRLEGAGTYCIDDQ